LAPAVVLPRSFISCGAIAGWMIPDDAYWHLVASLSAAASPRVRLLCCVNTFSVGRSRRFFLPLMVVYLTDQINGTPGLLADVAQIIGLRNSWFQLLLRSAYTVDLLFCVVGYVMTVRLFDSHISQHRADDARLGGRANFATSRSNSVIGTYYLRYDENGEWLDFFSAYPAFSDFGAMHRCAGDSGTD